VDLKKNNLAALQELRDVFSRHKENLPLPGEAYNPFSQEASCFLFNMSLRSWKGYQWLSICWVTLCWEGMAVASESALEAELSSRTKEASMRRLSCGSMRVAVSCC
jgi:hypothetical protein